MLEKAILLVLSSVELKIRDLVPEVGVALVGGGDHIGIPGVESIGHGIIFCYSIWLEVVRCDEGDSVTGVLRYFIYISTAGIVPFRIGG